MNYKGLYNDKPKDSKSFENGAHFQYQDLYKRLEKIAVQHNKDKTYKKVNSENIYIYSKDITGVNANNGMDLLSKLNDSKIIKEKKVYLVNQDKLLQQDNRVVKKNMIIRNNVASSSILPPIKISKNKSPIKTRNIQEIKDMYSHRNKSKLSEDINLTLSTKMSKGRIILFIFRDKFLSWSW